MKLIYSVLTLSLFSAQIFAGNVTGKANFKGTAPKAGTIKMNADPGCVKQTGGKPVTDETVVVNGNKTLKNVFVYVKEGVKNPPAADATPITFDQKACQYNPHVFGIRVGQTLKIVNSDPVLHNVHALPKSNPGFNMGMATQGMTLDKKFTKPELGVKIKCDVHGWMNAWAHVVDHPYFAVTDGEGNFSIAGLPKGEYTLEAVHEKLGTKTAKLTVTDAGGSTNFDF